MKRRSSCSVEQAGWLFYSPSCREGSFSETRYFRCGVPRPQFKVVTASFAGARPLPFSGPALILQLLWSRRGIGATLTKAQAVQTQLDVLADWIAELGENFDNDLNRVIPFEYSAKLAAAMELHGIDDPHTAWTVFSARAEALSDLHDRL